MTNVFQCVMILVWNDIRKYVTRISLLLGRRKQGFLRSYSRTPWPSWLGLRLRLVLTG